MLDLAYDEDSTRRRGHERRQDRRRAVHRGAGHGRRDAVRPRARSTRCSRSPTTGHQASSIDIQRAIVGEIARRQSNDCSSPRPTPARSARSPRMLDGRARRARHAGGLAIRFPSRRRPGRRSRRTRGSRRCYYAKAPACRPSPTTRASRSTRSTTRPASIGALARHRLRGEVRGASTASCRARDVAAARPGSSAHVARRAADRILFEATASSKARSRPSPAATHGFGYDPIFFYPPYGCTLAEVPASERRRSAIAARRFAPFGST